MVSPHSWIVLDRDGVINYDSLEYIKSAQEWIPIEGSIEAIAQLTKAGYKLVVATNQSGLGRELFELEDLEAMHQKMETLIHNAGGQLQGIFYCPHTPEQQCQCRKPGTGLFDAIENEFGINLSGAFAVGDNLRDLQVALKKNCLPVLVTTGKGAETLQQIKGKAEFSKVIVCRDLQDFSVKLIQQGF